MDSEDNLANLRVDSFSYYLNPKEQEYFVKRIGGLAENHSIPLDNTSYSRKESSPIKPLRAHRSDSQEGFVFIKGPITYTKPPLISPATHPTHVERLKSTDGEIDVFGADKYFSMKLECGARTKPEKIKEQLVREDPVKRSNSKQETRSVYSEASTWSSGISLLQSFAKSTSQTKPKRATGKRFSFCCTGPCLEKGAVFVKEYPKSARIQHNARETYQPKSKTGDTFVFPILNSEKPSRTLDLKKLDDQKILDLRKSLDVFGSDIMKKNDITKNLERKLSMLTWNAIAKTSSLTTATSVVTTTTICDDLASDASSDLFEIENISAPCGGYHKVMSNRSIDDVSGCMEPTTLYAPSEASIEWSVMTASGVDFSSAFSDYDPKKIDISGDSIFSNAKNPMQKHTGMNKEAPKSRPAGLLGCKSQKSVCVAETAHKTKVERY